MLNGCCMIVTRLLHDSCGNVLDSSVQLSYKQPNDIDDAELGVEAEDKLQDDDRRSNDNRFFVLENEGNHNSKIVVSIK